MLWWRMMLLLLLVTRCELCAAGLRGGDTLRAFLSSEQAGVTWNEITQPVKITLPLLIIPGRQLCTIFTERIYHF